VLLKINHDPLNEFESDDLTYDWYYESESDNYKTPHQITDIDVGEQGLVPSIFQLSNKKNYIVLRVIWEDGATRRFYCKVTNALGGEEVSVNSQPIDIINRAAIGY
jgi:hypothetical protein